MDFQQLKAQLSGVLQTLELAVKAGDLAATNELRHVAMKIREAIFWLKERAADSPRLML